MAFAEAGVRAVYSLDLPEEPAQDWSDVKAYLERMGWKGRCEYVQGDVTDQVSAVHSRPFEHWRMLIITQTGMWKVAESIGDKEGRFDVCVTSAGLFGGDTSALEYPEALFQKVRRSNPVQF